MDKDLLDFLHSFREETTKRFDEMGQEFQNVRQELSQGLQDVRQELQQEFQNVRQELSQGLQDVRQELQQEIQKVRQEFGQGLQGVRQELRQEIRSLREEDAQRFEKLETEVRGFHIVVESLRGDIQLVAEGVAGFTQQLKRQGEEFSRRLDTIESFTRLTYQDLDVRVRRLEAT